MKIILLNGQKLTIQEVIEVAFHFANVQICETALEKVRQSRRFIEQQIASHHLIYAINTGFGSNASEIIEDLEETHQLQTKLLLSHACGVGENFSVEMVRAIMLIRLNTLLAGYSGIQEQTVLLLQELINRNIHPIIPSQGSVGASGDLCPLSHMALALIGEGEVDLTTEQEGGRRTHQRMSAKEALDSQHLSPVTLSYKEGIALNNGTTVMAALGVIAVYEGMQLLQLGLLGSCLASEGLCARKQAFDEKVHQIRKHLGQQQVAQWIRTFTENSNLLGLTAQSILKTIPKEIVVKFPAELQAKFQLFLEGTPQKLFDPLQRYLPEEIETPRWQRWEALLKLAEKKITPQDAYSIRCMPQVLGASLQAIWHAEAIIQEELNAVVDNPLIFTDEKEVLSAGNFHGQPIALVLDYLKLAFAEMGNLWERQINKLLDPTQNDVLPPFLVEKSGLNSGYMIPQYVAASLVSENKVLVHPASADSIPTSANQEDHVSMGTIGGRQALQILENVRKVVAILFLTSAQAIDLRQAQLGKGNIKCNLGVYTQKLYYLIRSKVPYLQEDRLLHNEIQLLLHQWEDFEKLVDGK